uniref:Uncharacterized protein n=2 Tax=Meloidogyne TaxID=189290 RepID=A0A914KN99_MELIC
MANWWLQQVYSLACMCIYSTCYWVAYEIGRLIDDDSLLDNFLMLLWMHHVCLFDTLGLPRRGSQESAACSCGKEGVIEKFHQRLLQEEKQVGRLMVLKPKWCSYNNLLWDFLLFKKFKKSC